MAVPGRSGHLHLLLPSDSTVEHFREPGGVEFERPGYGVIWSDGTGLPNSPEPVLERIDPKRFPRGFFIDQVDATTTAPQVCAPGRFPPGMQEARRGC